MTTYQDFLQHVVRTLGQRGFIFLLRKEGLDAKFAERVGSGLEKYDNRTGKFLGLVSKVARAGADVPAGVGMFEKFVLGFGVHRSETATTDSVFQSMTETFDLSAVMFAMTGLKFLACVNCDELTPDALLEKARRLEEIAPALRAVQGKVKPKVLGMRVGRGIETDVCASLCLTFTRPASYQRLRPAVDALRLSSTGLGERYAKAARSLILNPMLFGHKGSNYLAKIVCRLYDRSVEASGSFRNVPVLGSMAYGFRPEELLP